MINFDINPPADDVRSLTSRSPGRNLNQRRDLFLRLLFVPLLLVWFTVGCNRSVGPPTPLPIEQVPSALQKAFAKAKPEAKEVVNQIVAALQAQDYSKAYFALQHLSGFPGLDKEQQNVTSRGVLTVNGLLQTAAQTKGDTQAAETLKAYRINK